MTEPKSDADPAEADDRRSFLQTAASPAMAGGLLVSYGTFVSHAGRFLFPTGSGAVGTKCASDDSSRNHGAEESRSAHYTGGNKARMVFLRFVSLAQVVVTYVRGSEHWVYSGRHVPLAVD